MTDYKIKDKGLHNNTESTSSVSTVSYEIENAKVSGLPNWKIENQLKYLKSKNKFPSNLKYIDAFHDPLTSLSGVAFLDENTGSVIVGMAGTNMSDGKGDTVKDLWSDGKIAFPGNFPDDPYFNKAHNFIDKISKDYTISTITGHSKGGTDSLMLGMSHDIPNIVLYNSAPAFNNLCQAAVQDISTGLNDILLSEALHHRLSKAKNMIKSYKGKVTYFIASDDPLTGVSDATWSEYPGERVVIETGKQHDIVGFLKKDSQSTIRQNTPNINGETSDVKNAKKTTNKELQKIEDLRKKFLKGGKSLSTGQKLYLDSAEALALTKGIQSAIKKQISDCKKIYSDAAQEATDLWQSTINIASSTSSTLSDQDILEALKSGGANQIDIKTNPNTNYSQKITDLTAIEDEYKLLIDKISSAISNQVATDQELARKIKE